MTIETFRRYLAELPGGESGAIELTPTLFGKLTVYFELLVDWNRRVNLTAITQEDDVFVKHFLDSLAGAAYLPKAAAVCDVGTGAGFPGLVLKLARPDISLTLMDSLNKRVVFLEEAARRLDVQAECVHIRAEDAGRSLAFRERFDAVVARAVAGLNTLYEYALPLVRQGGLFVAYKANCGEELDQSRNVPGLLGASPARAVSFALPPQGERRTLVLVKKLSATPPQYPRGKNRERSSPLS